MSDSNAISDPSHHAPDDVQLRPDDRDVDSMLPASDVQQVCTDALRLITGETIQASPPKEWRFLGKSDIARQMDAEPNDLVTMLRREFCDAHLIASRILVRRQNELHLNHVFGDRSAKFLLNVDAQDQPIDAISARGMLSVAGPSILPFARARRILTVTPKPEVVLVATTEDDLEILFRLGYTCVPAAGLSNLRGRVVEAILAAPNAAKPNYRYELAIVVGSIAQFSSTPSQEVQQILSHLQQIEPVYGRRPYGLFIVCWPDAAALETIRAVLRFRHQNSLVRVVQKELKSSLIGLPQAWQLLAAPEDTGLVEARREVCEALACANPIRQQLGIRRALPRLQRHIAAATVDKCWQAAQMASDPIMSALYLECGDILQITNADNPLIIAAEKVTGLASNLQARDHRSMDHRQRIEVLIKIQKALRPV